MRFKLTILHFFLFIIFTFFLGNAHAQNDNSKNSLPKWYVQPQSNNAKKLYGVAEGSNVEEATKAALVDLSSKLLVTISSSSTSLMEENKYSANEEFRKNIQQNIENIEFSAFKVSNSAAYEGRFFVEVEVSRVEFIKNQKEKLSFLQQQVQDLEDSMNSKENKYNPVKRRVNLQKIVNLYSQIQLISKILSSVGEKIDNAKILAQFANFKKELENSSDKIEFYIENSYFDDPSLSKINQIIRKNLALNNIKNATKYSKLSQQQIVLKIAAELESHYIYSSYMVKIKFHFDNYLGENIIASNNIEIDGASTISLDQAISSAFANLDEKMKKDGILKILGVSE